MNRNTPILYFFAECETKFTFQSWRVKSGWFATSLFTAYQQIFTMTPYEENEILKLERKNQESQQALEQQETNFRREMDQHLKEEFGKQSSELRMHLRKMYFLVPRNLSGRILMVVLFVSIVGSSLLGYRLWKMQRHSSVTIIGWRHFVFSDPNKQPDLYSKQELSRLESGKNLSAVGTIDDHSGRIFETDEMPYCEGNPTMNENAERSSSVAFDDNPNIVLAINFLDYGPGLLRYDVNAIPVKRGATFKLRFRVWDNSSLYGMRVQWIVVGNKK